MQCIIDADVWMEHSNGGTEPDNAWPAFKGDQLPFLSSCGALKFLFITYMGLNDEAIACLKYHPKSYWFRKAIIPTDWENNAPGTPDDEGRTEEPGSLL